MVNQREVNRKGNMEDEGDYLALLGRRTCRGGIWKVWLRRLEQVLRLATSFALGGRHAVKLPGEGEKRLSKIENLAVVEGRENNGKDSCGVDGGGS